MLSNYRKESGSEESMETKIRREERKTVITT
jgi:hypothetical protein